MARAEAEVIRSVIRSINFPVPFLSCSPAREAKLCPTAGKFFASEAPDWARPSHGNGNVASRFYLTNCTHTLFRRSAGKANSNGMRLGGPSFQKVKQPLRVIAGIEL